MDKYNVYVSTDRGYERKNNEDNFTVNTVIKPRDEDSANLRAFDLEEPLLCAVFDGVGGAAYGEVASEISARVARGLYRYIKGNGYSIEACIDNYIKSCNDRIVRHLRENRAGSGGTTAAMAFIENGVVKTFSIGDSRIYLYQDGRLKRISTDQTLAMSKYQAGLISLEEADNSFDTHVLTSYIGADTLNKGLDLQSYSVFSLEEGDRLLLCTDGLYDMCTDGEILEILAQSSRTISSDLVTCALRGGGEDNVTCIVIERAAERSEEEPEEQNGENE